MNKYDVIIVGSGPAGYFCAYELLEKKPGTKVLVIEKGVDIFNRKCPIIAGKIDKCPEDNKRHRTGCYPACCITSGFGGAGAFSDGKFNITSEFGGWLSDYISDEEVLNLIKYVDDINLKYGATTVITDPYNEKVRQIELKGMSVGLKLLRSKVRHLGTEENIRILGKIYNDLKDNVEFRFKTEVTDLIVENDQIKGVKIGDEEVFADSVVLAVGRDGSTWLSTIYDKYQIPTSNNQIDIGVRVETSDIVMREINEELYEGKFIYRTSVGTLVRTFCSNPSGYVVVENNSGVINANGHAFSKKEMGSTNTNFALLVSHHFDEPFKNPNEYGKSISRLANQLSCGSVIVQKFGDIKKGRRTNYKRLKDGFVKPTLKEAVPGDLALVLPYKTLKSLVEMIEALDAVTPGIATEHTLFYGVEAKYYSARPIMNNKLETEKIPNLYIIGDGAGITRGLAQAGSSGVYVARNILEKNSK